MWRLTACLTNRPLKSVALIEAVSCQDYTASVMNERTNEQARTAGGNITGKIVVLEEKPDPVPFFPPQI
jgi:hypothetical protein